ncbi:hypothetical protein N7470_007206 [Penicillium chermesinum]|nr:hypothetical protein N7470_007206 [Penicillium chermesinum]
MASLLDRALDLMSMDAVDAVRAGFLLAAATVYAVSVPSALRSRFLVYGPRATPTTSPESSGLLDRLTKWRVPHHYFRQFYIASLLSSAFWAFQLVTRGFAFQAIAARVNDEHKQQSMSLHQVLTCWILLTMQGLRRLLGMQHIRQAMLVPHWLLGLGFYLAAGVAIWIEGAGSLLSHTLTIDDLKMTNAPSMRTFACVPLFLVASGLQHDCHHFLFTLKRYTLPDHALFRGIVCPHYGAECIIYLTLALVAAPPGQMVNKTLLSCAAFVAVNLGLTARTTKEWYMNKFDREQVKSRWLMIPYVY